MSQANDVHRFGDPPPAAGVLLSTSVVDRPVRYWWVNQNKTHVQEQTGGYLWSPVRKSNGHQNRFYDFMREVSPGDVIFCFFKNRVRSVGIAQSYCFDSPKPEEFGMTGSNWENYGHRIAATYMPVPRPLRPKDAIERLRPLLPNKYSPLQPQTGYGLQSVYLAAVPEALAEELFRLTGLDVASVLVKRHKALAQLHDFEGASVTDALETELVGVIKDAPHLSDTERQSQVQARVGQGEFRRRVLALESCCRVTRVRDPVHLVASHIKPWRACKDGRERVDGQNGLALTPHIDHLFDKGFLSFRDHGEVLVSPLLRDDLLEAFHVDRSLSVPVFRDEQAPYLKYHREHVLRKAV